MSESRYHFKVGIFVLAALVLLGVLMLSFSKGLSFFQDTYELRLRITNAAGIKEKAAVMMGGIPIGNVASTELAPDGKSVVIRLKIKEQYKIYSDAHFLIDSMGFLGDQYIGVRPQKNEGKILAEGDEVRGFEPFDLQEVGRASAGVIQRVDKMAEKLNASLDRLNTILLSEASLNNLSNSFANFRQVSERAIDTVDGIDRLFDTNSVALSQTLTNLSQFSTQLNQLGEELTDTIVTNRTELLVAVKNLQETTVRANRLLESVEEGKGVLGGLMKDEQLRLEMSEAVHNLNVLSSNLSNYGILFKPKKPKKEPASRSSGTPFPYQGKR
jgi:phospholipid/cholesterol/gamma-HCH transport system substrate-binding protein